jgi:fructuronate reductase
MSVKTTATRANDTGGNVMHLQTKELINISQWEAAGIRLPAFDRAAMIDATQEAPTWVHFGGGNIFRAFPAALQQMLLEKGLSRTGIVAVEGYDYEIVDRMYRPHDNLSLLVTLKADGTIDKAVIASIAESIKADSSDEAEFSRLRAIFRVKNLQMASFTITEKGYNLKHGNGDILPAVKQDFAKGPKKPESYIGKIASLCYERYKNGAYPIALVSMDNCSHNGKKLYDAVHAYAVQWVEKGLADHGFLAYIEDTGKISFPWSMIDKITPRPDDSVKVMLQKTGFEDVEGEVTAMGTYIAPFVNAEETQYLVIEDVFPNGRPPLEEAGVLFTDRETVDRVEQMKVCTCLNPLHTALAIFGCLFGYRKISEEMKDADLNKLVKILGYQEGLPVVIDSSVLSPRNYIDEVLQTRIPNPFMPDTPQRIATDTSQKLKIRFGRTIQAYLSDFGRDIHSLRAVPLVLAGWCRYLLGIGDDGKPFDPSPDPMLDTLRPRFAGVKLGQPAPFHDLLYPVFSDAEIFGANLYRAGLGDIVESAFAEMMVGPGAVRATIRRHLAD